MWTVECERKDSCRAIFCSINYIDSFYLFKMELLSSNSMTYEEAFKLIGEPYSYFTISKTRKHISLSPAYIGNVSEGLHEAIRNDLKRYSPALQGIPMAYDKPKCVQRCGYIMDESPYIHFDVEIEYVVFQPKIGSILQGCINKVSEDNIGCLVHGTFNASIHKPHGVSNSEWIGKDLSGGDDIVFVVTQIHTKSGIVSFYGEITSDTTSKKAVTQITQKRKVKVPKEISNNFELEDGSSFGKKPRKKDHNTSESDSNNVSPAAKKPAKHECVLNSRSTSGSETLEGSSFSTTGRKIKKIKHQGEDGSIDGSFCKFEALEKYSETGKGKKKKKDKKKEYESKMKITLSNKNLTDESLINTGNCSKDKQMIHLPKSDRLDSVIDARTIMDGVKKHKKKKKSKEK